MLNAAFRRGLSLGVNDGSSAIRLYRTDVVNSLRLEATDYDILQEVLVRAYVAGWRVLEFTSAFTDWQIATQVARALGLEPPAMQGNALTFAEWKRLR